MEPEIALEVASLEFSSNRSVSKRGAAKGPRVSAKSPILTLGRFVELCLLAEQHRLRFTDTDVRKMSVERLLAFASASDERFDFDVLECLPPYAQGAFACIVGTASGHIVLLEEEGYKMAVRGSSFRRHVICHEYGHHVLHGNLLSSSSEVYLPPQEWSRIKEDSEEATGNICQIVDTPEEIDAECFATMMLVPWTEFLKGTEPKYLAKDFGEQLSEVERYARYFKNPAVVNSFRQVLWERGEKSHPIFMRS